MGSRVVGVVVVLSVVVPSAFGGIWYVDGDNASPSPNGESWPTAFPTIQGAIDAAAALPGEDHEVWVAEGTYTGTGDAVVTMAAGVHLYGGFIGLGPGGEETARDQRDWDAHLTVIDGEDTRFGVVGADGATLDGFTVTRGAGDDIPAGVLNDGVSPTVAHCTFASNDDSGMYSSSASPTADEPATTDACKMVEDHTSDTRDALRTMNETDRVSASGALYTYTQALHSYLVYNDCTKHNWAGKFYYWTEVGGSPVLTNDVTF